MNAKIKMRQYVIFIKPQKFNTIDIKCFAVPWSREIVNIPGSCLHSAAIII